MSMPIPDNLERRVATRYKDNIQVDLIMPDDSALPVEISSISIRGIQLVVDGWLADEIEPLGIQKLAMSRKKLKISADLPFDATTKNIIIHSYVISVRRLSQEKFLIGLEYEKIAGNGANTLDAYIDQLRQDTTLRNFSPE